MQSINATTAETRKARLKQQFSKRLAPHEIEMIVNLFYQLEEASENRGEIRAKRPCVTITFDPNCPL